MTFPAKLVTNYVPAAPDGIRDAELDALYRSYYGAIRRYVLRTFGPGPPDPEDVVQTAFQKFSEIAQRNTVDNPKAFLVRSARNYVIDQRRRQIVRSNYLSNEIATSSRADDWDAERVLSAKERLAIIDRAIHAMDARRREVLIMNRIHGISCAEIARHLNRSPTLVKLLLAEAVTLCQQALREAGGE